MLKVALADIAEGHELHTHKPYNGETVLVVSNYHEDHGVFKATNIAAQSTTIITEPDLGGAIVLTQILIGARKNNLAVITLQMTDGANTEIIYSAELANEALRLAVNIPYGWRGWVNARLEIVLSGADTNIDATVGYTKIPNGEDFAVWDAKR